MTDVTLPPPHEGDRIEPVDIQIEMQRSFLDYAMSVIVSRALPDVRDGLKPVHRRVLYGMYDGGYRPDRSRVKCAKVVGDVMGTYHPHGDSAIYDTLVRLAQPWSMRHPLVDGQGNFGSPGNDPAAAMRYCLAAGSMVRLADGASVPVERLVEGAAPNSDTDIAIKVLDRNGNPVLASKFFHSGDHATRRITTSEGFELTGSLNHPVLCLVEVGGIPTLLWRLLEEIAPGERVALFRGLGAAGSAASETELDAALLAGAWVSEGWVSETRAGFNNIDEDFFAQVLASYDAVVGGSRYVYRRVIASGSKLHEIDIQDLTALKASRLGDMIGHRSEAKRVPDWVQRATPDVKQRFLQALFEGDGSCSLLPRATVQVSYSTRSHTLAKQVQLLLLEFGIVSRLCFYENGEIKVYLGNRREARLFAQRVGFLGRKQSKLLALLDQIPQSSSAMSRDHVPFVAGFLRAQGAKRWTEADWLRRHNIDRTERWERDADDIWARVTNPEARSVVEPLVDGRFYYAEVATVEDAGVQPVYSIRVDSDDHSFIANGFVNHNTECRLAPLAMEMLRDIDQETVDFNPNYDGTASEPAVLPSRIPNILINASAGIAVGMATNIPPHNLREVNEGVQWYLQNPTASDEELLDALMERIKGPDFPTGALIVGRDGIEEAFRTGRGSIRMRSIVEVEEDRRGRQTLVITELPYQVNPDNLAEKIADLVKDGKIAGIADVKDESSARTGQRLVIVLKRDAIAKVVLNNLYKHTPLQDSFGVNTLALVDGVPRTLNLAQIIRHWTTHQIEVIVRRTKYRLRKAEERAHILRGLLKAIDRIDEVIALIRASESAEAARGGLMELLTIDEIQAVAILDMQLRRLAALERNKLQSEYDDLMSEIAGYEAILASEDKQREIIGEELGEIAAKYGNERRSRIVAYEGDLSLEDLIADEDVVVTITRGGYAKRTKADLYRQQRRGGKGVSGAALKQDDIVEHFFVTSTHNWILFFTNKGRVYRAKAHELQETARSARGQHVANVLGFQPDEKIAQVMVFKDYNAAPYLVLATRHGLVKKTALREFDSNRTGGVIAINLRENDELVSAALASKEDDLLLVSRRAMSIRFHATDEALRPMGRATSGVIGMRFADKDELLSMDVVRGDDAELLVATDGGFAKRTRIGEYPIQGRGGRGVYTAKIVSTRGQLVGALIVVPDDEIFAITSSGGVIRTKADQVRRAGRQTMGVRLINLDEGATVVAVTRSAEPDDSEGE
ncbi:MAG: gyrase subunit [Frankiales bacterium]|nr:gyrase subunit [Frankiales bacterium]